MNAEQIIALLQKVLGAGPIIDTLGLGARNLYQLLLRQVYLNAFSSLIFIPIGLFIYFKWVIGLYKDDDLDTDIGLILKWIAIIVLSIASLILILAPIFAVVQVLINPDYEVIKLLMDTAK